VSPDWQPSHWQKWLAPLLITAIAAIILAFTTDDRLHILATVLGVLFVSLLIRAWDERPR
jgi:branched-subunit amino acid transport protein